jgi:ribose/xylose/arabinose/galactoside ABC-type transport system permease subunit
MTGASSARLRGPGSPLTLLLRVPRALFLVNEFGVLVATMALALAMSLWHSKEFATWSNVQNMSNQGAPLAIVAMGQMFPLLVGGFDISVGALMGIASVAGVLVMVDHGLVLGIAAGIGFAAALGLANGILVSYFRITAFVVTLGMLSFGRGLALELTNGTSVIGTPSSFLWFGTHNVGVVPSSVVIAGVVTVLVAFLLMVSRAGIYFYSTGGNEEAARLAGVNVRRYKLLAYVISASLAGLAGLIVSSQVVSGQPTLGQGYELDSIAVAVIGGVAIGGGEGSVIGVLLGVTFLTVLRSGLDIAQVSSFIQQMATGLIIVLAVVWDRARRSARRPSAMRATPVRGAT